MSVQHNDKKRILVIFGTRPEAVKLCPLINRLKASERLETLVCVTGQHREMLDQVLSFFGVVPDIDLNIMHESQPLEELAARVLEGVSKVLSDVCPQLVLVHGDTTSAFASALACFYMHIPVGHVEAGLRTWDLTSPFPEEFNRQAISSIAKYHFAPTDRAASNLYSEGKSPEDVFVTGNTVIDALKTTLRDNYTHPVLKEASGRRLVLVTAHRRENIGEPMRRMFRAIRRVAEERDDVFVVYPIHRNPAVRDCASEVLDGAENIMITEPLDVFDFHNLLARSSLVLTDSGGIQEEAQFIGKPVLVMRNVTERPEGVEQGNLKIVGTEEKSIYESFCMLLDDKDLYASMSKPSTVFGDGHASDRIAEIIERLL